MEHSPSWEANQPVLSQSRNPLILWNFEGSLPRLQMPAALPNPELDQSSSCPHPISWRTILKLSSYLRLGLPSGLFPEVFPPNSNILCCITMKICCRLYVKAISSRDICYVRTEITIRMRAALPVGPSEQIYSQRSTNKMHNILPYGTLQQRALLHVSIHIGSSTGHNIKYCIKRN
jgi:hypothetical protein